MEYIFAYTRACKFLFYHSWSNDWFILKYKWYIIVIVRVGTSSFLGFFALYIDTFLVLFFFTLFINEGSLAVHMKSRNHVTRRAMAKYHTMLPSSDSPSEIWRKYSLQWEQMFWVCACFSGGKIHNYFFSKTLWKK